jgi:hypothetical protein
MFSSTSFPNSPLAIICTVSDTDTAIKQIIHK